MKASIISNQIWNFFASLTKWRSMSQTSLPLKHLDSRISQLFFTERSLRATWNIHKEQPRKHWIFHLELRSQKYHEMSLNWQAEISPLLSQGEQATKALKLFIQEKTFARRSKHNWPWNVFRLWKEFFLRRKMSKKIK